MKLTVTYVHCIKATPGQLDREPWYRYECRQLPVTLEPKPITYDDSRLGQSEWIAATEDGRLTCVEDTQHDAIQQLLYALMVESRTKAEASK